MELEHLLKQLKRVNPNEGYSLRSRMAILETLPAEEVPALTPWRILTHSLQFGSSIAMVGLLLILIVGGFSTWSFLSPFRMASLDPASLRAEAQAVDIQLEMTKIQYSTAPSPSETTAVRTESTAPAASGNQEAKAQAETQAKNLGILPASSSPASVTIDDALEQLSE